MEYLINIDQYDFVKKSRAHDNVSFMLRGSSNNSTRLKPVVRTAASTILETKHCRSSRSFYLYDVKGSRNHHVLLRLQSRRIQLGYVRIGYVRID
jgi:CRISPR/Cas system-associated exonuclease Cas4 (RecB family)